MTTTFTNDRAHNTAISRRAASRPARWAMANLKPYGAVLDFGCGRGKDVEAMREHGWKAEGFDPYWQPVQPQGTFSLATCNYVLNVIPKIEVRSEVLERIHGLLEDGGRVFVSARSHREIERARKPTWEPCTDGYITPQGTFQHGVTTNELSMLLEAAGFQVEKVWRKRDTVYATAHKPR